VRDSRDEEDSRDAEDTEDTGVNNIMVTGPNVTVRRLARVDRV
jgi:hypothetical protein